VEAAEGCVEAAEASVEAAEGCVEAAEACVLERMALIKGFVEALIDSAALDKGDEAPTTGDIKYDKDKPEEPEEFDIPLYLFNRF
jgi:hypothetical protein